MVSHNLRTCVWVTHCLLTEGLCRCFQALPIRIKRQEWPMWLSVQLLWVNLDVRACLVLWKSINGLSTLLSYFTLLQQKKYCILFVWKAELRREREREREPSLHRWLQESGLGQVTAGSFFLLSHTAVQTRGPFSVAFPVPTAGLWIGSKAAGISFYILWTVCVSSKQTPNSSGARKKLWESGRKECLWWVISGKNLWAWGSGKPAGI